ncbi:protein kinase family protein [Bacillaceae bacterium IKA-2]|nr:protein kinase family protein [Bacillaceae bacterium IKA-2]
MQTYNELAQSVKFKIKGSKIVIADKNPQLDFAGEGRSAFVFKIRSTNKVLKVFLPPFSHLAQVEAEIYKDLLGNPFYPVLYEYGTNYIVIDYIEGNTLFNCLLKGILITNDQIKEIDYALLLTKENGLNPSDIHLRNILITPRGSIKLIDVARFRQIKPCSQWNDIKTIFEKYYKKQLFPKMIPAFLLNLIAFLYKKNFFKRFLTNMT